jgi:tetratricopeptide (TPR) repeat protein/ADP-heptose:LPS heptosyltransferase
MALASKSFSLAQVLAQAAGLQGAGRLGEAATIYRSVLRMQPQNATAQHLLGVCLLQGGQAERAVKVLSAAVRQHPGEATLRLSLAQAQRSAGRRADALGNLERAAALSTDQAAVRMECGMLLEELGRYADALAHYERILETDPAHAQALIGRANCLLLTGQFESALVAFDRALSRSPADRLATTNRAIALTGLGRAQEAVSAFDEILARHPGDVHALVNRGNALYDLDRFEAALASHEEALQRHPGFLPAMIGRVVCCFEQRRYELAVETLNHLLTLDAQHVDAHVYRGMARLMRGDYAAGWADYEWRAAGGAADTGVPARRAVAGSSAATVRIPRLPVAVAGKVPAQLRGRAILLTHEQGHGDTVQFVRYAAVLKVRGARVVLRVQPALADLLRSLAAADAVVTPDEPLPPVDFHCPLMSLPHTLGTTFDPGVATVPYLSAPQPSLDLWHERLGSADTRPCVGVAWSGSRANANDRRRSIRLAQFAALLRPGVRFVSLQPEMRDEDRRGMPEGTAIEHFGSLLRDFADTAALIAHCDLVISVDTAAAHLAGAMGKPVWILLPFAPDWRWQDTGETSHWYPTARLFRQPASGDWEGALAQVRVALQERFACHESDRVDVPKALDSGVATALVQADPVADHLVEAAARHANDPAHLTSLGMQLHALGRPDRALEMADRVVALAPGAAVAWANRALSLDALGRPAEALASYARARVLDAGSPDLLLGCAKALCDLGRYAEALESLDRCLREHPGNIGALDRRARALRGLGRLDEAIAASDSALQLHPRSAGSWAQRGCTRALQCRHAEALADLDRAVQLAPDDPLARFNRGLVRLALGQFPAGWEDYEARDDARILARSLPGGVPLWKKGQEIAGKTLVLHSEQGAGDTLQFCRFAPLLARQGAHVQLIVPSGLLEIMSSLDAGVRVHVRDGTMPAADLQCELLSVAHRLDLDPLHMPVQVPYLRPARARIAQWRDTLARGSPVQDSGAAFRIGLACSGNPANSNDRQRSIALAVLAPVIERLRAAGAQWHLVQNGLRASDEPWLERLGIRDHRAELTDFSATAALVQCMDVVVSVDTAPAHLAGALGVPLRLLLPACPDWRWLLDRGDTPWYPGARLFRQAQADDWDETLSRVAEALVADLACAGGRVSAMPNVSD